MVPDTPLDLALSTSSGCARWCSGYRCPGGRQRLRVTWRRPRDQRGGSEILDELRRAPMTALYIAKNEGSRSGRVADENYADLEHRHAASIAAAFWCRGLAYH